MHRGQHFQRESWTDPCEKKWGDLEDGVFRPMNWLWIRPNVRHFAFEGAQNASMVGPIIVVTTVLGPGRGRICADRNGQLPAGHAGHPRSADDRSGDGFCAAG